MDAGIGGKVQCWGYSVEYSFVADFGVLLGEGSGLSPWPLWTELEIEGDFFEESRFSRVSEPWTFALSEGTVGFS
jgi:hypothetical protein